MPQLHHRHPTFHVGRHPNKRIKVKERAYKQARKLEDNLVEPPMPSIILDLGVDRVSELIRSVTKDFEDTFQDVWLAVIEDHVASEEDILRIAREVSHKHATETISKQNKEISLDEPIGENRAEGDFTLKDILQSPQLRTEQEIDHDIDADTQYVATSTGKVNRKGSFYLDDDTKAELKRLYPHDTIHSAIRKVVGMPPAERDKRGWYKWEDAIIKQRYPWGGARACSLDICRSLTVINSRAKYLGVQATTLNAYKPCPDWLNIPELAERLGCKYGVAARLEKTGKIKSIRVRNYHQGHDGIFFTPEAIDDYLNSKELHRQEVESRRVAKYQATWEAKRIAKVVECNTNLRAENTSLKLICRKLQRQLKLRTEKANRIAESKTEIRWERVELGVERRKLERRQMRLDRAETNYQEKQAQIVNKEIALQAERRLVTKTSITNERKADKLKQRQIQLTQGARRVGQRLRRLAWVEKQEAIIYEAKQELQQQKRNLQRETRHCTTQARHIASTREKANELRVQARLEKVRLRAWSKRLERTQRRLEDREQNLAGLRQKERETTKEIRRNLHKQDVQLRRKAKSNEKRLQWVIQSSRNLREGRRALQSEQHRLQVWGQQLGQEEQRINDAREEYRRSRRTDFDIVLETMSHGHAAVAKWGDKSHYVSIVENNTLALACTSRNSISIGVLRESAFNPFVNEPPTCRKCLGMRSQLIHGLLPKQGGNNEKYAKNIA